MGLNTTPAPSLESCIDDIRKKRMEIRKPVKCQFRAFADEHFPGFEIELDYAAILCEAYTIRRLVFLRHENKLHRAYAALTKADRFLYICKGLSDVLLRYSHAGYDTRDLFENAVRAVYPKIEVDFTLVWMFQRFSERLYGDELDNLIKIERALIVLTQKPGWV